MEQNTSAQKEAENDVKNWEIRQALMQKPWAEATADEKMEKMKMALTNMQQSVNHMQNLISSLQESARKMKRHSHNETGVVISIDDNHPGMGGGLVGASSALRRNPLD